MAVQADFSQVGKFVKGLEKAQATVVRKAIRNAVKDVAGAATSRVQAEAGTFSHRIGPNVSMKVSFAARGAGAKIATNLKVVPWARLYERGGEHSNGSYWKHPVFGSERGGKSNDPKIRAQVSARWKNTGKWPKQNTHPFFYKSVWGDRDELKNRLAEEVGKILADIKEG